MGGFLGDGSDKGSSTPKQIGIGYLSVSAGGEHSVAIKSDGSVTAWGGDSYGQTGVRAASPG